MKPDTFLIGLGALFLGGLGLIYGSRKWNEYVLMRDTPTSKIRSASMGLVELKGVADGTATLSTPVSKTPCLFYEYIIYEMQRRGSGKSSRLEWVTISEKKEGAFMLKDDTGTMALAVDEANLDLDQRHLYSERKSLSFFQRIMGKEVTGGFRQEKPNDMGFMGFAVGDRKHAEYIITQDTPLYVMGTLTPEKQPIIKQGEDKEFVITDKSEEVKIRKSKKEAWGFFAGGIGLVLIGVGLVIVDFV